jgi:hypothetical protein
MSLLDRSNADIVVYLEETVTDSDGNEIRLASATGIASRATIRPQAQSGTSARRAEQMDEGFFTEETYTLRLPRGFPHVLGAQARIDWGGESWSVFGAPIFYNGSRRTQRYQYKIVRN